MLDPMSTPEYDSPASLRRFLEGEGLAMAKRLGQNFLIDRRQRERILAETGATPGSAVWEIGPGIGAMTSLALDAGLGVTAFEIDHGFVRVLRRLFGERESFRLVAGDFLDTWRAEADSRGLPGVVFGNLPYSAASAMIAALLEQDRPPHRMVFTVQKEAAARMAAKPGTKDYSAFSILCTSNYRVRAAFDLGSSSFWPAPNVTSSVVVFVPRPDPVMAGDRRGFSAFVRACFSSRRKTMRNNLKSGAGLPEGCPRDVDALLVASLNRLGRPPDARAEALPPEELASVYRDLKDAATPRQYP